VGLRQVRQRGDAILSKKCKTVKEITPSIIALLEDMKETLYDKDGVGIAAPQVGVLKRICIVAHEDDYYELINPEILEEEGTQACNEACLSVAGLCGDLYRPFKITVRALDRNGEEFTVTAEDFLASVFCHELDHLDGIIFIDKAINIRPIEEEEIRKSRRGRAKIKRLRRFPKEV